LLDFETRATHKKLAPSDLIWNDADDTDDVGDADDGDDVYSDNDDQWWCWRWWHGDCHDVNNDDGDDYDGDDVHDDDDDVNMMVMM